ncbi:hypothetical protein [Sphingomonas tagetis]|uniref:TetR/AcrR family transcriptional regulator n=1 Tax=Sphingomonas tagetis TaxID=2949092 RepID=UPI00345E2B6D
MVPDAAGWLGGKSAEMRAALMSSQLIGLLVMRSIIESEALAADHVEQIVAAVAPTIQSLADS